MPRARSAFTLFAALSARYETALDHVAPRGPDSPSATTTSAWLDAALTGAKPSKLLRVTSTFFTRVGSSDALDRCLVCTLASRTRRRRSTCHQTLISCIFPRVTHSVRAQDATWRLAARLANWNAPHRGSASTWRRRRHASTWRRRRREGARTAAGAAEAADAVCCAERRAEQFAERRAERRAEERPRAGVIGVSDGSVARWHMLRVLRRSSGCGVP